MKVEITFRELRDSFRKVEYIKIIDYIVENMQILEDTNIPQCHNINTKILLRFSVCDLEYLVCNVKNMEKKNKHCI